jgi:hypothetical protein
VNRKLHMLSALGIILLLGALFFNLSSLQTLLEKRDRSDLNAEVQRKAGRMTDWENDMTSTLIILAEQKGLRDGVMKMAAGEASREYKEGFLGAISASCRLFAATHPGVEGLTLRGPDGSKWVGSGVQLDSSSVVYLDYRMRYQKLRMDSRKSPALEQWVVPVRDVQAKPLAFLVADVNLARAPASDSSWTIRQTQDHQQFSGDLNRMRRNSIAVAAAGIALLALAGYFSSRKS